MYKYIIVLSSALVLACSFNPTSPDDGSDDNYYRRPQPQVIIDTTYRVGTYELVQEGRVKNIDSVSIYVKYIHGICYSDSAETLIVDYSVDYLEADLKPNTAIIWSLSSQKARDYPDMVIDDLDVYCFY